MQYPVIGPVYFQIKVLCDPERTMERKPDSAPLQSRAEPRWAKRGSNLSQDMQM